MWRSKLFFTYEMLIAVAIAGAIYLFASALALSGGCTVMSRPEVVTGAPLPDREPPAIEERGRLPLFTDSHPPATRPTHCRPMPGAPDMLVCR